MKQTIDVKINNINAKALHWWRSQSDEWKRTMIHNPKVNTSSNLDSLHVINRSTSMIRRMFINWLKWGTKAEEDK
jgi:hypothetical protein